LYELLGGPDDVPLAGMVKHAITEAVERPQDRRKTHPQGGLDAVQRRCRARRCE
jgi:hypothetical protein